MARTEDFSTLVRSFNRAEFGLMCRKMEIAIIRGHAEIAERTLREYLVRSSESAITLDDFVGACLPVRIANALSKRKLTKLRHVDEAKDTTLLAIPNLSYKTVLQIRRILASVKAGTYGQQMADDSLSPEWAISEDDLDSIDLPAPRQCYVDQEVIDEIDADIEKAVKHLRSLRIARDQMIVREG